MTAIDPARSDVAPITHAEAAVLAEEAYARLADLVASIRPDEWTLPTECEGWTVRDLAGHLVGAMRSAASIRELLRQQLTAVRRARRSGRDQVDEMTALQIELAADLTTDQLVAELRSLVGPAAAGRRRTPAALRRLVRVRVEMGAISERWSLGYLVDVILTRDAWLHRVDLARALGRDLVLTPEHDARIVADVAAEWARRHGQPCRLVLTGPAGGTFLFVVDPAAGEGAHVEHVELDAVDFCRTLSGRASGDGLLATAVPF